MELRRKRHTIKEIAEHAGVASSTVSRVLNNKVTRVAVTEETKRRIARAVDELGYFPNVNARRLSSDKTFVIGLQVPGCRSSGVHAFSDHTLVETMRGVEDALGGTPYKLLLIFKDEEYVRKHEYLRLFQEKNVDGLLIWGEHDGCIYREEILDFPVLFLNARPGAPKSVNYIGHDNYRAGFAVTEYLLDKGRRDFLYISANGDLSLARERNAGVAAALAARGLELAAGKTFFGNFTLGSGFALMDKILASGELAFDAVICANDSMAIGVYQAALRHGKKMPEDFALVGIDGVDAFGENFCPLTTFKVDCFKLGRRAVERLFHMVEGGREAPSTELVNGEIIIRRTA